MAGEDRGANGHRFQRAIIGNAAKGRRKEFKRNFSRVGAVTAIQAVVGSPNTDASKRGQVVNRRRREQAIRVPEWDAGLVFREWF
jgi:hypothetical protein